MPELPDVELFKRYLDTTSLHQTVETVEVTDNRILGNVSSQKLQQALQHRQFKESKRHGKHLFARLNKLWLVVHFGMTGFFKYLNDYEKMPSHPRVLIKFTNEYYLVYNCQRLLGEVNLVEKPEEFIKEKGLGPDALDPEFDLPAFEKVLSVRKGMLKSTLMNQHIISGLGNIYTDETLFQAAAHPQTKVNYLTDDTKRGIFRAMKQVLQTAIDCGVRREKFPTSYLFPHRGTENICPRCRTRLKRIQILARGTYFCPKCQKK